jgi:hypothetical protein
MTGEMDCDNIERDSEQLNPQEYEEKRKQTHVDFVTHRGSFLFRDDERII